MGRSVLIVQARMGSSRLPGKVLMDLAGQTALAQCLRRCLAVPGIDAVVCAVPEGDQDAPVAAEAARCGAMVVRGPSDDVLRRYRLAADRSAADIVMRVTSDCPLIDPATCGRLLALLQESGADYACNNMPPSWPHGLDAEVFTAAGLRRADEIADEPFDREHVTPWLRRNGRTVNFAHPGEDLSHHRWTLDYPEDYAFLEAVFGLLPAAPALPALDDVLAVLAAHPELSQINQARHGIRAVPPPRVGLELEPCRPDEEHARLVMAWRNDPVTRAVSFHHEPKRWETFWPDYVGHYFPEGVPHPVFVTEGGRRVAYLGFRAIAHPTGGAGRSVDISINVAPAERGRGIGAKALRLGLDHLRRSGVDCVLAEVRQDNPASQKSFLAAGFAELDRMVKTVSDTGESCPIIRYVADLSDGHGGDGKRAGGL